MNRAAKSYSACVTLAHDGFSYTLYSSHSPNRDATIVAMIMEAQRIQRRYAATVTFVDATCYFIISREDGTTYATIRIITEDI